MSQKRAKKTAKAVAKAEPKKRGRKAKNGVRAMTAAEKAAAYVSKYQDVGEELAEALKKINWKRRNAAGESLATFAETYGTDEGGFLEEAPPPEMVPILDEMQAAIGDSSVPYHIRVARGHGKTSYTKCAAWYVLSYALRRYAVVVAAAKDNAVAIVDDLKAFALNSPKWAQDFPEIAVPLRRLGGAYQRAKTQKCNGNGTNIRVTETELRMPLVRNPRTGEPFANSGCIVKAVGFNAGARGLVRGKLRPDLVIFDDLQNDEMAENPKRILKAALKVKKTFLGLAGHRKKIAAIMTSTPIQRDDLSEIFAREPGWRTSTYKMLKSWPAAFQPKKGRDLWGEYDDIFQAEKTAGRPPHIAANRFYRANRAEMDAGSEVLNPHNFDPATEVSAIQHAMNLYYRDGAETFMCEYQMEPPQESFDFDISARLIMEKVRAGTASRFIPPGTVFTAAATDINPGYAITTAVVCFDIQRTGFVTAYHVSKIKIPDKLNDTEFNKRVYRALVQHGREIAALGIKIDAWGVDAGGRQFKTVTNFAPLSAQLCGIQATAMLGRADDVFNPNVKTRKRKAINDTVLCGDEKKREWLAWDADVYKESAQKCWGTEVGEPGGLSLFDGNANHIKFATQIANEKLEKRVPIANKPGRYRYKWQTKNPHDFGDCVAMCYALAGAHNLTGTGEAMKQTTKRKIKIGNANSRAAATAAPAESSAPAEIAETATADQSPPQIQPARRKIKIGHA